jgi:hypothetical protein
LSQLQQGIRVETEKLPRICAKTHVAKFPAKIGAAIVTKTIQHGLSPKNLRKADGTIREMISTVFVPFSELFTGTVLRHFLFKILFPSGVAISESLLHAIRGFRKQISMRRANFLLAKNCSLCINHI